jgi:hypothetical protein
MVGLHRLPFSAATVREGQQTAGMLLVYDSIIRMYEGYVY